MESERVIGLGLVTEPPRCMSVIAKDQKWLSKVKEELEMESERVNGLGLVTEVPWCVPVIAKDPKWLG